MAGEQRQLFSIVLSPTSIVFLLFNREELSQLTSVDQQKKEILVTLPQGRDTLKALNWLANNRQNFRGQIYNPIMLQMNVENEDNAIYLENVVPIRDLVAFGAESADDMNALLNEFRYTTTT